MKYLIPTFNCEVFKTECYQLLKNIKYQIESDIDNSIVFSNKTIPFLLDLNNENILKVDFKNDLYIFLFPINFKDTFFNQFKFNSHDIIISISNYIRIFFDSELICEKNVENLKFSHFEIIGEFCFIYFEGKRNFLVALKSNDVLFDSYYDECNINENEKYFMCKLNDSLNHGVVFSFKNKEYEKYLVYLDNDELKLKDELLPMVFLDCVKAKNFKYCNNLLCDELKVEDEKQIEKFFPDFDFLYPISSKEIILINKNTLAGIFEFVIEHNEILNIMSH